MVMGTSSVLGCGNTTKLSMVRAEAHVGFLVETAAKDVEEVRRGLPQGADQLGAQWKTQPTLEADLKEVHQALEVARRKVQDLRVAKSTFFALADLNGNVLRNDQDQDRMSGRPLFGSFPNLRTAKERYVETLGSMPEASGVRAPRPDGEWVAGTPVKVDGAVKGLYVTGWAWSSYAYRLEFALRGQIKSELADKKGDHEPLVYAFVVVGKSVYGAPVSPDVSRSSLGELDPLSKVKEADTYTDHLDITGRTYGVAVKRAPSLGPDVAIAVLRSET
jgi:hypothetical protein